MADDDGFDIIGRLKVTSDGTLEGLGGLLSGVTGGAGAMGGAFGVAGGIIDNVGRIADYAIGTLLAQGLSAAFDNIGKFISAGADAEVTMARFGATVNAVNNAAATSAAAYAAASKQVVTVQAAAIKGADQLNLKQQSLNISIQQQQDRIEKLQGAKKVDALAVEQAQLGLQKLQLQLGQVNDKLTAGAPITETAAQALGLLPPQAMMSYDALIKLASANRDLFGGSTMAAVGVETVLERLHVAAAEFPQATKLSADLAASLGIDASQAALMLGKALETPGQGLLRLKAAGVTFTAAQDKVIKAMAASGDMAGAQKAILDALSNTVGGTAATMANTLEGQLTILQGHFGDWSEQLGGLVIPALGNLVRALIPVGDALMGDLAAFFQNSGIQAGLTLFSNYFAEFTKYVTAGVDPLDAFKATIGSMLPPNVMSALDTAHTLFANLVNSFKLFPNDTAGAIANFFYTIGQDNIGDALLKISTAFSNLWAGLASNDPSKFEAGLAGIGQVFASLWATYIQPALVTLWTNLVAWLTTNLPLWQAQWKLWADALVNWINPQLPGLLNELGELLGKATAYLTTTLLPNMVNAILGFIGGSRVDAQGAGAGFFQGFADGFGNSPGWQSILTSLNQLVIIIKLSFVEGLMNASTAAQDILNGIGAIFMAFFANLGNTWAGDWNLLLLIIKTAITNFVTNLKTALGTFASDVKEKIDEVIAYLVGIETTFFNAGLDLFQKLYDGFIQNFQNLRDAVFNLFKDVINSAEGAMHMHSPSKDFLDMGANARDSFMANFGQLAGLAGGVMASTVNNASSVVSNNYSLTVNNPQSSNWNALADFQLMKAL